MRIELSDAPEESDLAAIERGLREHATTAGLQAGQRRPLHAFLRDDAGELLGGAVAATGWGWLEVQRLWVAVRVRGQGHGRALLEAVENEARQRGCVHARLDTFDFQAPAFYERAGYRVFGTLDDFPSGHSRFFMTKRL